MNKFIEFYQKAMANEESAKRLQDILGDVPIQKADVQTLDKLVPLAKSLGFEITADEAEAYLYPEEESLQMEDLDAVAGGKGDTYISTVINGPNSGDISQG